MTNIIRKPENNKAWTLSEELNVERIYNLQERSETKHD